MGVPDINYHIPCDYTCNLLNLYINFILILMYKLSKIEENVNIYRPEMLLRTGPKVKMKLDFTDRERVLRSPYYVCNRLWDKLHGLCYSIIKKHVRI